MNGKPKRFTLIPLDKLRNTIKYKKMLSFHLPWQGKTLRLFFQKINEALS
jgi:hypothetical protein